MPIDTSIYSLLKPAPEIDPLKSYGKAVALRDLVQQGDIRSEEYKRKNLVRDALSKNVQQGQDGKYGLNKQAALSDIYKADGLAGIEAEDKFQMQDAAKAKAQLEESKRKLEMSADLLWGITDQASYQANISKAREMGLLNDEVLKTMPPVYNKEFIDQKKMANLGAMAQLQQQNKDREFDLREKEIENGLTFKSMFGLSDLALKQQAANLDMLKLNQGKSATDSELLIKKQKADLEKEKFEFEKRKPRPLDKVEEFRKKEAIKEQVQIEKEDRKLRNDLDKAETSLQSQLDQLNRVKTDFEKYSKNAALGTGPIATGFGLKKYFDQDLEDLDSQFNKVGLDEMVKMFAGMSKAVDSEGERRAFTSTQPSISLDDNTNRKRIEEKIKATESLLKKTREAKAKYDKAGKFESSSEQSPSSDQTKIINGVTYKKVNGGWERVK
jgi:hypothetical protein